MNSAAQSIFCAVSRAEAYKDKFWFFFFFKASFMQKIVDTIFALAIECDSKLSTVSLSNLTVSKIW